MSTAERISPMSITIVDKVISAFKFFSSKETFDALENVIIRIKETISTENKKITNEWGHGFAQYELGAIYIYSYKDCSFDFELRLVSDLSPERKEKKLKVFTSKIISNLAYYKSIKFVKTYEEFSSSCIFRFSIIRPVAQDFLEIPNFRLSINNYIPGIFNNVSELLKIIPKEYILKVSELYPQEKLCVYEDPVNFSYIEYGKYPEALRELLLVQAELSKVLFNENMTEFFPVPRDKNIFLCIGKNPSKSGFYMVFENN